MGRTIRISQVLPTTAHAVWDDIARLETHAEWMSDVESIRFLTNAPHGQGTQMEVTTRLGPFRTTDVMEFTIWDPPLRMGVHHSGLVSGEGVFSLRELSASTTELVWEEQLDFPLRFGGRLGAWLAAPILRRIWRRNLGRLAARFVTAS